MDCQTLHTGVDIMCKEIFDKIDEGTVTADDFNKLILEATPESVRDRVRRRPMAQRNTVKSHQDEMATQI